MPMFACRSIRAVSRGVLITGLLLGIHALQAEDSDITEIALHPQAIESPHLKYRLLPAEGELKPGNAAPILLRLPWEQTQWMSTTYLKLHEWESRPLTAPEWATSEGVLPSSMYSEMKRAAYRRDAFWEYPLGETPTPYFILLPDAQGLRGFLGRGLAARIRYHLTRGELDLAREGILVGLANGRHVARTPFYVNQLVALAIHRTMLNRTAELISQPGSPNLYWALSALPDSMIEMDRAASYEAGIFSSMFPGMNELGSERSPEEWQTLASQLIALLRQLGEWSPPEQETAALLKRLATAGRKDLLAQREFTSEKVAAMSDDEVAARWYTLRRVARDQEIAALLALAPREAWAQLAAHREMREEVNLLAGTTQAELFDPSRLYVAKWSLKRKIAALRVIEGVRHYAAGHAGRLPEALSEITSLPIPLDPLTDQPFVWHVEGQVATLQAPALPKEAQLGPALAKPLELQYRLKRAGNEAK